jgi:hypothetical protein
MVGSVVVEVSAYASVCASAHTQLMGQVPYFRRLQHRAVTVPVQRYRPTCVICTVTRMTSNTREVVRNQLLIDALGGPIDLNVVDRRVKHENPSASPVEVQNETLDAIREWVGDELFRIGAPVGKSQRFEAWHHSLDHSLHKISHDYVKHYEDPEKWMFAAWLSLTGKGELLGRSLEEKDIDGYRTKST